MGVVISIGVCFCRRDEGSMKVIEFLLKDEEGGESTRRHYASVAATSCLKRLYTWLSPNVNVSPIRHGNFLFYCFHITRL